MVDSDMIAAWLAAERDLGVRVVAPHELRLADGNTIEVEAFLPDFGGPNGAVAVSLHDDERCRQAASTQHFVSGLGDSYRAFERGLFKETMDDWGWYGPSERRPEWNSGSDADFERDARK
jgi:hypothetical protein